MYEWEIITREPGALLNEVVGGFFVLFFLHAGIVFHMAASNNNNTGFCQQISDKSCVEISAATSARIFFCQGIKLNSGRASDSVSNNHNSPLKASCLLSY